VILKESRGSLSLHTSVLNFLKSSSGTPASPSVLLETRDDDNDDDEADNPPTVQVLDQNRLFETPPLSFKHSAYGRICLNLHHLHQHHWSWNHLTYLQGMTA